MPIYRILTLGTHSATSRKIVSKKDIECASEEDAIKQAEQLADGHDIELWERGNFIQVFKARYTGKS